MSARHARMLGSALAVLTAVTATLATAPSAWAAPPSNDDRADAVLVDPPQTLTGTLGEATLETTNDESFCANTDGSVWYHFTAPARGAVVVQLDAGGEMDATIDLFKQVRSKLSFEGCRETDANGDATLDVDGLAAGADYAIRVGNQTGSVADTFTLRVLVPKAPPSPPGRHLPRHGVRNHVDRVLNPGDAYWTRMRAGRTMRLSLRTQHCTSLAVFGPGTRSFTAESPEKRLVCGGFRLFTPTQSGRYFLVVSAARDRDVQHYRLQVAPARRDDTTPGVQLRNHERVKGKVNLGLDSRDLYRFDATRRSALALSVSGSVTMELVRDDGHFVARGDEIRRRVPAGRYYVVISGSGRYKLRLALRAITHATLLVNRRHVATIGPDTTARFSLAVRPRVVGPAVITIERLDPVAGWQFLREYQPRVVRGSASVSFHPPSVGRYRARADYLGSRNAAASSTGYARLLVQRPLGQ